MRDIDRLLGGTLAAEGEGRLRLHLSVCEDCRRRYDEALLLERALTGDVHRPTAREDARVVRRALALVPVPGAAPRAQVVAARPFPLRRVAVSVAGAALAVAAVLYLTSPVATLVEGDGVRIGGELAPEGAPVRLWSHVEVDGGGYGLLSLNAAEITLSGGTSLRVGLNGRSISLARSKVWCEVERGRSAFAVRTDEAVARVTGTSFAVERSAPGVTAVRVREGSVEVSGRRGGPPVALVGGTKTTVRAGAAPEAASAYDGVEDADVLILLRRLGRAIGRGIDDAIEWLRQAPPR